LQKAWIAEQAPQCGYCQSGMLMAAAALLASKPKPSDEEIDAAVTNLCRCGTYQRVRAAIHRAATEMAGAPAAPAPTAAKVATAITSTTATTSSDSRSSLSQGSAA
jgi:isoquinoline 1-oxidoreductase alpha subunit